MAQDQIITFDPPGSFGTVPTSINPNGEIARFYSGPPGPAMHGFVRDEDGTITSFDPPGVGPNGTFVASINPSGEITGYFFTADNNQHGFVRAADGTITTFDAPNAGLPFPSSINPVGTITGSYADASGIHGFVRDKDGTITSFDVGPRFTSVTSSNPSGEITGTYIDASFMEHALCVIKMAQSLRSTWTLSVAASAPQASTRGVRLRVPSLLWADHTV